jgi:hypothetical protein
MDATRHRKAHGGGNGAAGGSTDAYGVVFWRDHVIAASVLHEARKRMARRQLLE